MKTTENICVVFGVCIGTFCKSFATASGVVYGFMWAAYRWHLL